MYIIYLGFILFIAGVAFTIFHDKVKEEKARRAELVRSRPPRPITTPRARRSTSTTNTRSTGDDYLDRILYEAKQRRSAGQRSVQIQTSTGAQTMTVEELIKKLETMKKKL